MATNKTTAVIVTIADEAMEQLDTIKAALQANGLEIERVMPMLGVIAGTTSDLAPLRAIKGVESVSIDYKHTLPPSDSAIQ